MKHLEDQLQESCVKWFRYQYPDILILHPKNGGSLKSAKEGAKFKKMGVLAGTPDLFIMRSKWGFVNSPEWELISYGLWIELKDGKNQQSEAQKEFEQKAKQAGYAYEVCRSIDEFMEVVNEYLT